MSLDPSHFFFLQLDLRCGALLDIIEMTPFLDLLLFYDLFKNLVFDSYDIGIHLNIKFEI
jgi:hypothetical protein